jgi:hypothetical protein
MRHERFVVVDKRPMAEPCGTRSSRSGASVTAAAFPARSEAVKKPGPLVGRALARLRFLSGKKRLSAMSLDGRRS